MSSPLQVTANRANALRSTGPRSPAGKAAVARNALKHGVLSWRPVVLPGESAADWNRFARALLLDLQPDGPAESLLAGRIASILWRLQRLACHQGHLARAIDRDAEFKVVKTRRWQQRRQHDPQFPATPDYSRQRFRIARAQRTAFRRILDCPPDRRLQLPINPTVAVPLIESAAHFLACLDRLRKAPLLEGSYPGLGTIPQGHRPNQYAWTAAHVYCALQTIASWAGADFTRFLQRFQPELDRLVRLSRSAHRRAVQELARYRQVGPLRSIASTSAAHKYEVSLERSLARAMAQLGTLQALRGAPRANTLSIPRQAVVNLGHVHIDSREKPAEIGFVSEKQPDPAMQSTPPADMLTTSNVPEA